MTAPIKIQQTTQFGRAVKLFIANGNTVVTTPSPFSGVGPQASFQNPSVALDLSAFRIKFDIKRTIIQSANIADIRIYNVSQDTAIQIQKNYNRVILQAGYQGNYGVIFSGTIRQCFVGRDSATETFVDIVANDGDLAYNYAFVNTSLKSGAGPQAQVDACAAAMGPLGVTKGGNSTVSSSSTLPRGKVMFGPAKKYARSVALNTQSQWSIQDGQLTFVPLTGYLSGTAVKLNSQTGLVGSPQQTLQGVNAKCLLNPFIQVGTRVQFNQGDIQRYVINLENPITSNDQIPIPVTDGLYYVLVAEHIGDNRGIDWYTNLVTLTTNPTQAVGQGINVGY